MKKEFTAEEVNKISKENYENGKSFALNEINKLKNDMKNSTEEEARRKLINFLLYE